MRVGILVPLVGIVIGGCSAANAAQIDPANDVHCSALALAFRLVSDQQETPTNQKTAVAFVDDWYGRKLFQLGKTRGKDKVLAEAQAIAEVVESDPLSFKNEFMSCTNRAIKDAGLSS